MKAALSSSLNVTNQLPDSQAVPVVAPVSPQSAVIRWDEKAGLRTGCSVRSQVFDALKAQRNRRSAMKKVSAVAAPKSRKIWE
jgi:hypothetical protein